MKNEPKTIKKYQFEYISVFTLYETDELAVLKTHYYGGIRKYQWVTIPLALHGVVVKADGTVVNVCIGEDPSDPVIYINDLLPHLAKDQSAKPLGSAIPAEGLNLLMGSRPYPGCEGGNAIRLNVLALLNEKYGITEEDFLSADLSAVPAAKARDVGLDRSLIGAYGHDDRVCAYPSITALFGTDDSVHTSMVILADKEEVGSDGNTGMQCELMTDLMEEITRALGGNFATVKANSKCLSSDVTANFEPNFPDVFELRNSSIINCGVSIAKYTGSGGKGGTIENPSDLGNEFIYSVMERLGIDDTGTARALVRQAFEHGQIAFNNDDDFSNYIGWHSNANGDFVGFWYEGIDTAVPANATHINRSFGYLGEADESHGVHETDMMYATVRVREEIATGDVTLA